MNIQINPHQPLDIIDLLLQPNKSDINTNITTNPLQNLNYNAKANNTSNQEFYHWSHIQLVDSKKQLKSDSE